MATINTVAVTALAASQVRKSEYRGNVQWIPVEISADVADGTHSVVFSDVLPANTELIGIQIEHSAIAGTTQTLDIGYTGDADAIIDGADLSTAGGIGYPGSAATAGLGAPVDVSGKQIIGELKGQLSSDTINGYLLIVTDE
jgi:hypothetical protein